MAKQAAERPASPARRTLLKSVAATAVAAPLAGASLARGAGALQPSQRFADRLAAGLYGMAIGDGMGAPVEGWAPEKIRQRFGDWNFNNFLPSTPENHREPGPGKGQGRLTDDMLLVEALMRAYLAKGDHMDAYDYARYFMPEIAETEVFVPEQQATMPPLQRPLWWPERYAYHRLVINNVEPRIGGLGNWTNQGLQGFVLPVGAVNAGDPDAAYAETVAWGVAHNHSFALEGAAVMAAGFAQAFLPGATIAGAVDAMLVRARDGTRECLDAVLAAADPTDDLETFISRVRKAYLPYAGLSPSRLEVDSPDTSTLAGTDMGTGSRIMCIENLPVSLATLLWGKGDFVRTCKASIRYGQDCESIAAASLGMLGVLFGPDAIPAGLLKQSAEVNRRDYFELAGRFAGLVGNIMQKDTERLGKREEALA